MSEMFISFLEPFWFPVLVWYETILRVYVFRFFSTEAESYISFVEPTIHKLGLESSKCKMKEDVAFACSIARKLCLILWKEEAVDVKVLFWNLE